MNTLLTVGFRRVLSLLLVPVLFVLAQPAAGVAKASCVGADPAIASAAVKGKGSDGRINHYALTVRVVNLGRAKQPSNLLQSVNISENGIKLDMKGVPPLRPGQSYTFTYVYQRSVGAGDGTTNLDFQLSVSKPSPPGSQDCNAANDSYTLNF